MYESVKISGKAKVDGSVIFFFNDTATTEIYTLSLHDALPICTTKSFKKVLNWLDWFISNNSRQSYIVNAIRHPMFHTLLVEHSPFSVLCDNNLSTSLPIFTLQDNHLKVHPIKRYSLLTDILPVHKHDSR